MPRLLAQRKPPEVAYVLGLLTYGWNSLRTHHPMRAWHNFRFSNTKWPSFAFEVYSTPCFIHSFRLISNYRPDVEHVPHGWWSATPSQLYVSRPRTLRYKEVRTQRLINILIMFVSQTIYCYSQPNNQDGVHVIYVQVIHAFNDQYRTYFSFVCTITWTRWWEIIPQSGCY